jgi:hypothetical protein
VLIRSSRGVIKLMVATSGMEYDSMASSFKYLTNTYSTHSITTPYVATDGLPETKWYLIEYLCYGRVKLWMMITTLRRSLGFRGFPLLDFLAGARGKRRWKRWITVP